jgi:hypothetical protein
MPVPFTSPVRILSFNADGWIRTTRRQVLDLTGMPVPFTSALVAVRAASPGRSRPVASWFKRAATRQDCHPSARAQAGFNVAGVCPSGKQQQAAEQR